MHDGRIEMARKNTESERVEISRKHVESLVRLVARNLVPSRLQIYAIDPWVHGPQLSERPANPVQHGPNSMCYCGRECVIPPSWRRGSFYMNLKPTMNLGSIGAFSENISETVL